MPSLPLCWRGLVAVARVTCIWEPSDPMHGSPQIDERASANRTEALYAFALCIVLQYMYFTVWGLRSVGYGVGAFRACMRAHAHHHDIMHACSIMHISAAAL